MRPVPTALPDLDAPYTLSGDARRDFERDGHVLLRRVAMPDEVAAYRPLIREATFGNSVEKRALDERDTYGRAFIQVGDIWKKEPAVAGFTLARRFGRIAAELLGVTAVRLYHDQALFKEPGGGPTPWHQDQYYWPLESDRTVTMWMPSSTSLPTWAAWSSDREPSGVLRSLSSRSLTRRRPSLSVWPRAASSRSPSQCRWPPATRPSTPAGLCTARCRTPRTTCERL
jgi:Phytanoyl-CoA dioxygenase (PhyH)